MQQVICTALDYLPYGDGLPGEEEGAAAGDGVAALDAAVVAVALWVLWGGDGGVFVGEGPGVGPGAGLDAVFVRAGAGAPGVAT